MIASGLSVALFLCCVVPVVAPNAPDDPDLPLGRGHFANPAFKVATALVAATLPSLLNSGRLIRRGTHYKNDGGHHPIRKIVSLLLRIDSATVKRHLSQFKELHNIGAGIGARGIQEHLPEPSKRGPRKKSVAEAQAANQNLFEALRDKITHACDVSKLWTVAVSFFFFGGGGGGEGVSV